MTHGAVLVNLSIRQFGNEKTDKSIVREVAQRHNATFSQDRYLKQILPPAVISTISSQVAAIRAYHYRVTSPWFDRGIRMMAAKYIPIYQAEIGRLKQILYDSIKEVAGNLNMYEAEAIRTRGSLYTPGDIPSPTEFINAYKVKVELVPVSLKDDFRVDYISNKTKDEYEKNNKARFEKQTQHLIDLVLDPLLRLEKVMSNQERSPKIHGTTIEQLEWWADSVADLLVDKEKEEDFVEIGKRIKSEIVSGYNAETNPKYDPHAIEGALVCIKEMKEKLDAHTIKESS